MTAGIPAETWHFARDGEIFKQALALQLPHLASTGEILSTDFAWREGMEEWQQVRLLFPGLFSVPRIRPRAPVTA